MMYQIWRVIETTETSFIERFYVVNRTTSQVQSTWKDYRDAKDTCDDLNLAVKTGAI